MIKIKNSQRKIKINLSKIKGVSQVMLNELGYGDFDLGIWFTTNKTIRNYNKKYRNKDKATDILSFAYHELKPGEKIIPKSEEDKNLGDLIISLEYIKKERLTILLAHGITHLLGYDHETDREFYIMQRVEKRLLKAAKMLQPEK